MTTEEKPMKSFNVSIKRVAKDDTPVYWRLRAYVADMPFTVNGTSGTLTFADSDTLFRDLKDAGATVGQEYYSCNFTVSDGKFVMTGKTETSLRNALLELVKANKFRMGLYRHWTVNCHPIVDDGSDDCMPLFPDDDEDW